MVNHTLRECVRVVAYHEKYRVVCIYWRAPKWRAVLERDERFYEVEGYSADDLIREIFKPINRDRSVIDGPVRITEKDVEDHKLGERYSYNRRW